MFRPGHGEVQAHWFLSMGNGSTEKNEGNRVYMRQVWRIQKRTKL